MLCPNTLYTAGVEVSHLGIPPSSVSPTSFRLESHLVRVGLSTSGSDGRYESVAHLYT
jgi:hypothetical protein